MVDVTQVTLINGVPAAGEGDVSTFNALMADGGQLTLGSQSDIASEAAYTDDSVSTIGLWKQISKSLQLVKARLPTALGVAGGLKVDGSGASIPVTLSGFPSHPVTNAGSFPVQVMTGRTAITDFYISGAAYYSPNLSVGGLLVFPNVTSGNEEEELIIDSASLSIDRYYILNGETTYRLALFSEIPSSNLQDGGHWTFPSGDRDSFLGFISLGALSVITGGQTCFVEVRDIGKRITIQGPSLVAYLLSGGSCASVPAYHRIALQLRSV